jgi:uncharacterized SAM-binding protein YcdF (DUF218 family)
MQHVMPAGRLSGWLVRVAGAALAFGTLEVALTIGLSDVTSVGPTTLRLGALVAGALIAPTRFARWLWFAAIAAMVTLLVVLYTPLVERPTLSLLRADAAGAPADAIVVYSGAMTDAGEIGDIALSRLVSALEDAQRLGMRDVVVSVQSRLIEGRVVTTEQDQTRLVALLGGAITLHTVTNVRNTHDESLAFAALARTRGWTRLRATTDPLHARRACQTLEATGVSVMCAPSTPRNVTYSRLGTPGARLAVTRAALHEAVGLLVYKLRGWL